MRILVLADIHGNRSALHAITEPRDACLCVGDLVDYGPEPGPCIDWVKEHALACVRGNHDHGAAQNVEVIGAAGFRYLTAVTRPFTVSAISSEQRRFLAQLPTSRMLTLDGKRFLLVHATPRDPMDEFAPPDVEFWEPRVAKLDVDFVCVGHTHQPYVLKVGNITVVNPGSVGLSRDGDPRASYAVIENGEVQLKRVDYPIEQTIQAVMSSEIRPTAKKMLSDLYRGGAHVQRWIRNGIHGKNGNGKHEKTLQPAEEPGT